MEAKDTIRTRAARVSEELRETGRLVLRAPVLVRGAEYVIRFLLGAMLAGADIFGGYAPFGMGMTAASGAGLDGFSALVGACFGYLTFQGFAEGLRYAAASILIFSAAFAFYDVGAYRRAWFMPSMAALMDAVTGFVYLSRPGLDPGESDFFQYRGAAGRGGGLLLPYRPLSLAERAGRGVPQSPPEREPSHSGRDGAPHPIQCHHSGGALTGTDGGGPGGDGLCL